MDVSKINVYVNLARKIEKQLNCKIYIVGGYVRDRIVSLFWSAPTMSVTESIDLDFAVEGIKGQSDPVKNGVNSGTEGQKVAEAFHKKLGGELTVYKKFLTATLKLKNGFVIDIATARKETYPTPAAMPVVSPARIEEDLKRRDFTINALALPLTPTDSLRKSRLWGQASHISHLTSVIDVSGGLDDLKNKLIRVLHKNSFTDDPTRILRAIRYAWRFNFKLEKNTEKWMKNAIEKNLLSLVSAPRIRDEFIKALEEKKAKKILEEFKKRKILKYIDDKLDISAISENKETMKTRLKKLLKNFTEEKRMSFLKKLCLPVKIS